MFDAALTELGKKQAQALGVALSKMPKNALWITSPLTRAIETCIIGRKAAFDAKAVELKKAQRGVVDDPSPNENVDDLNTPSGTSGKHAFNPEREFEAWTSRLMIREELTEKLSCSGDIGRPRRYLEADFPELELALSRIPEDRWWWEGCEHRPNDAQSEQFKSLEPQANFKRRVARFRDWLLKRPEETFVVFGHSTFFKEFSKSERSMKNCEIHEMRL
jgi:broad specificity phosphatase PhoE